MSAHTRITYILINGPASSGKSTSAPIMCRILRQHFAAQLIHQESFAGPMKNFIASALSAKYSDLKKEVPIAELNGYTPREFLIHLSEEAMKPRYGEDIFGRLLHYRVLRLNPIPRFVVCDDCGFDVEREALPTPIVIRLTRPSFGFDGDSRGYLSYPDYTVENNGTLFELETKLAQVAAHIIAKG